MSGPFVQLAPVAELSSPTSPQTVTFSNAVTPGNLIAVFIANQGGVGPTTPVVTDSEGNKYNLGAGTHVSGGTGASQTETWIFYAQNVAGQTPATITVSWTGTTASFVIYAVELAGVNAFAGGSSATGTSATAAVGPINLPSAGVVFAADINTGSALSVGTGYTLIQLTSGFSDIIEYSAFGPGSSTAKINLNGSQGWGMAAAGFYNSSLEPTDAIFFAIT
jgi:hypothetical protein